MSLHAKPTDDAIQRLHAQRRNSTISSFVIALLVITLIGLVLGFFLLPNLAKEDGVIVTYTSSVDPNPDPDVKKAPTNLSRKPSAPSMAAVRVIAAQAMAEISIPVPEVEPVMPSMDFGDGDNFGDGWDRNGDGATGGGGMFGSTSSIPGALKGRLFDFKQDRRGKPISYDPSVRNYADLASAAERRDFAHNSLTKFFMAPHELNLTHFAIPFTPADRGPEYFGAKETIQPSGWLAVYQGRIVAPVSGRYRFRGAADDYMVVLIEGRRNLVACWPDTQQEVAGRWKGGKMEGSNKSPLGNALLYAGDWMDLKAGVPVDIGVGVGERPGGMVGFVLEIEQEGVEYRRDSNGRKILPLFTTTPFTEEERREIQDRFKGYEFEWDKVPVFGVK